jgi:hypothetical protein
LVNRAPTCLGAPAQSRHANVVQHEFEVAELDGLNDDLDQLTKAIGELSALNAPQREGPARVYPSLGTILTEYD